MIDTGFDFSFIWSTLGILGSLVVFGICLYFIIVKPCAESILLGIGSFIHLLTSLFYSVGTYFLVRFYGTEIFQGWMFAIVSAIGFIGTAFFTAGLIVLIIKYVRIVKKMKLEKYSV
jgi:hypothetical protein